MGRVSEARPQEREIPEEKLPEGWRRQRREPPFHGLPGKLYYEREDGAYAWFDETNASDTAKPWLQGYRPWIAFPPPPPGFDRDRDRWPPLCYEPTRGRWGTRGRRTHVSVTRRWKTALAAMGALDRECPREVGGEIVEIRATARRLHGDPDPGGGGYCHVPESMRAITDVREEVEEPMRRPANDDAEGGRPRAAFAANSRIVP